MAWKGSGEERIRRFELYRLLEARYEEAKREIEFHKAQLAGKDRTIRMLAAELASAPTLAAPPVSDTPPMASEDLLEAFASEQVSGPVPITAATVPSPELAPSSRMTTSNAPPIGKSEMRPARTSVANGEGKELARSIRERLEARAGKR